MADADGTSKATLTTATETETLPPALHAPTQMSDHVNRVSVKPPPFFRDCPDFWFKSLESQFALAGISQTETKYHHVISALPEDVGINLGKVENTYEDVKKKILALYTKTKQERLSEALGSFHLNGEKPSLAYQRLMRITEEAGLVGDDFSKQKLLGALPDTVKTILTAHTDMDGDHLARMADALMTAHTGNFVAAITTPDTRLKTGEAKYVSEEPTMYPVQPAHHSQFNQPPYQPYEQPHYPHLGAQRFQQPYESNPARFPEQQPFQRESRGFKPFSPGQRPKICDFHIFFAERAKSCTVWCKWPGEKPPQIRERSLSRQRPASPSTTHSEN